MSCTFFISLSAHSFFTKWFRFCRQAKNKKLLNLRCKFYMKTFRIVIFEVGSLKNRKMEKVMCVCVIVYVSPQEHTNVTSLQTYINHSVLTLFSLWASWQKLQGCQQRKPQGGPHPKLLRPPRESRRIQLLTCACLCDYFMQTKRYMYG